MPFQTQRGISPFAERNGIRGMPHVIPNATRNLPPSRSVRGLGDVRNDAMSRSVVGVSVAVATFVEVVVVKHAAFLALECVHRYFDTVHAH